MGVEPTHLAASEPKSDASTNSAKGAITLLYYFFHAYATIAKHCCENFGFLFRLKKLPKFSACSCFFIRNFPFFRHTILLCLAGDLGFEPRNVGIKIRCLNQLGESPTIWCRLSESNTLYLTKPDYKSGAIPLCASRRYSIYYKIWYTQGNSNPCSRRERAMS
jgi:hypothetical protein